MKPSRQSQNGQLIIASRAFLRFTQLLNYILNSVDFCLEEVPLILVG